MIPTLRQSGGRRRRRRGYNLPFAASNRLALDAAVHDSITTAGGAVSLWEDVGPSGRDFASLGVTPDHDGTDDIVNFNGSNDFLIGGSGLLPATGDFTLVLRFGFTGGRNNTPVTSFDGTSTTAGTWAVDIITSNVPRFYITPSGDKAQLMLQGSVLSAATQHVLTVTRSGHVFTLRTGGTQQHQLTDTGALRETYSVTTRLGVRYNTNYLLGGIQRFGVWGQAFTGGDLDAVEDWATNG